MPRVLVVDDDELNLTTFERCFRRDLVVHVAASGADAIAVLERGPIDVVLADYSMPEMDGLKFLGIVKSRWPNTGRLLVTAYLDMGPLDPELVHHVVTKPWDREDILERVRAARISSP